MPVTSPSISGVGVTPNLLEGSSVVGFFADGNDEQQPVIMGSFPGIPTSKITEDGVGFRDPTGKYPTAGDEEGLNGLNEPDISRLARGKDAETHGSLTSKRTERITKVPIAKKSTETEGDTKFWDEPHPRFGDTETGTYTEPGIQPTFADGTTSVYPYNRVTETESGHVFEVDDTPGNGRIHEYHNSGTFYEVQADGTKVTKVVGTDYEIVINGKNLLIKGDFNVNVDGNYNLRVEGDMYEEIQGNKITSIGNQGKASNRETHIQGNDVLEVVTNSSTNVGENHQLRVGGNQSTDISLNSNRSVLLNSTEFVGGNSTEVVLGNKATHAIGPTSTMSTVSQGKLSSLSLTGTISSTGANMELHSVGAQVIAAGGSQLIETVGVQTLSTAGVQTFITTGAQILTSASQTIVAPTRSITGITGHTGAYVVTGALSSTVSATAPIVSGTSIVRQGSIILGTHKHTVGGSAAPFTGTPTP